MIPSLLKRVSGRRGFTMIEIVIVLGVAAIILAGVWMGAARVREKAGVFDTVNIVREIHANVVTRYAGLLNAVLPATPRAVCEAGIIPVVTWNFGAQNNCAAVVGLQHAMGGQLDVIFDDSEQPRGLSVVLYPPNGAASFNRDVCADIVAALPGFFPTQAVSVVSDAPFPNTHEPLSPAQEGNPNHAYLRRAGGWIDVSNTSGLDALNQIGNSNCERVALYYSF